MMSPVVTGRVWVTFFPLIRVPFLVCRGWSLQFPLSSRKSAMWLRETVGKSRSTSENRLLPTVFSQWRRSNRVPSFMDSQPQISFPGFSRNRDSRHRAMTMMAKIIATTRRTPQATGRTMSMTAPTACPVSALARAERTWSASWVKINCKRMSNSCIRPSFLRRYAAGHTVSLLE